jgi:diadenosine tetraphosphatase ApaH/serine/threonine PP2A family protein phosphatase
MNHHDALTERATVACRGVPRPLARLRSAVSNRVLSAPDTWERHLIVADLVGSPVDLVDVGGLPGQLSAFLPSTRVLAVNVSEPADMVVAPEELPFRDATFEASTSLDVLEHVDPSRRAGFISELVRVARRRSVLCCPLGTPEHVAAERKIHEWYRRTAGDDHPWLVEHLANGLPTLDELRAAYAATGARVRFHFHGDVREVNDQFRRIVLARHRRRPADVAGYAAFRLGYRPDTLLSDEPTPWSNRVFAVAEPA